jgi:HAD superfamily hydrolase (TIGR01509 family)
VTDRLEGIRAITFDFGNTLVPVDGEGLARVVDVTADAVVVRMKDLDRTAFLAAWSDERDRQFREDIPRFREIDLAERLVRVFARLRGMKPPPDDQPWDQASAARLSDPEEVAWVVETYSRAFVDALPPAPDVRPMLRRLAEHRAIAILSNWPLAATIDRYAEANGWLPFLAAIVISQRVGMIKPHPAIFEAARRDLGGAPPSAMLHVGDDWAADVVGAAEAGWHTAWIANRPADTPLPTSVRDDRVRPDLELATLGDLESRLGAIEVT